MMKRLIPLLFLLLTTQLLQAQQQSAPKDSVILRRFFHSIGRCCKNTIQHAKAASFNAIQQYHNTPKSTNTIDKRLSLSLNAGANYYMYFGQLYFPFDTGQLPGETHYSSSSILAYGNVSYTYVPGFGYHAGLLCALRITRAFSLEGGIMYSLRTAKRIKSTDFAERNMVNNWNAFRGWDMDNFKEIDHSTHQFEIPIYFGYTYKRLDVLMGIKFKVLTIYHTLSIFTDNSEQNSDRFYYLFQKYTENNPEGFINPSLKIRYNIIRKKIPLSVYLSTDWLYGDEWDLLAGIQVGIFSK